MERIEDIARKLVSGGKGILAADESNSTIAKRFTPAGIENTETNRRDYREMLFSDKEGMQYISGVILYDETIRQKASDGRMLTDLIKAAGAYPGIKVDAGSHPLALFPGEETTDGLDGLRDRLKEYYGLGARFAKWRAVINIDSHKLPSFGAVKQNADSMARYAALCQENGVVPMIEPEILMDGKPGDHSLERCREVSIMVQNIFFDALRAANVKLEGMILKPNMVIEGIHARKASVAEVARETVKVLKETTPAAVAGIAFLSGGQSDEEATAHLSAMNAQGNLPWPMTFSYGRALQAAAIKAWAGKKENIAAGQKAFAHRARMNYLAALGKWSEAEEKKA